MVTAFAYSIRNWHRNVCSEGRTDAEIVETFLLLRRAALHYLR